MAIRGEHCPSVFLAWGLLPLFVAILTLVLRPHRFHRTVPGRTNRIRLGPSCASRGLNLAFGG